MSHSTKNREDLFDFARILGQQTEFHEILRLVAHQSAQSLRADMALILMLNPDTRKTMKTIIKDGKYIGETDGIFPNAEYTFPGEGDGEVEKIVKDLLKNGYDGGFSMEPHMSVVFHDGSVQSADEIKYNNYVEYGKRFMQLVEKVQAEAQAHRLGSLDA